MKERLIQMMEKKKEVKLIFEYPNSKSAKVRRGCVIKCGENSFDFLESKHGLVTYSYKYLVEINERREITND